MKTLYGLAALMIMFHPEWAITPSVAQQAGAAPDAAGAPAPPPIVHHRHKRHHHRYAQSAQDSSKTQAALHPIPAMAIMPGMSSTDAGAGEGLTPMGAILAGNREGTIPPWTGGLASRAGVRQPMSPDDPFADERPLFTIDASNVDRYTAKLAAGTVALIKAFPNYSVDVYPTHRTFAAPGLIYDNALANMHRAVLTHDGATLTGAVMSIPYPVPHSGSEAMWNHLLHWRTTQITRTIDNAISTAPGKYVWQRWHENILFPYSSPAPQGEGLKDVYFAARAEMLEPKMNAGLVSLIVDHRDPATAPREAWSYVPHLNRVITAPDIGYDTPLPGTDGLETMDDYDLFNGPLDRYDWKLVGRRELYVPYNTNALQSPSLQPADLLGAAGINPKRIRYELHRVWQVEGTLKPGFEHIYAQRTLYLDEDSWQALISDRYDHRGDLWRTAMAFPVEAPEGPAMLADGYEYVDLYQHRFMIQGLRNRETPPILNDVALSLRDYSSQALHRLVH